MCSEVQVVMVCLLNGGGWGRCCLLLGTLCLHTEKTSGLTDLEMGYGDVRP